MRQRIFKVADIKKHEEIANAIKSAIHDLSDPYAEPIDSFENGDPILELGLLDSAGIMNLIAWYESHYNITIEQNEFTIKNLGSITAMVEFVLSKQTH